MRNDILFITRLQVGWLNEKASAPGRAILR